MIALRHSAADFAACASCFSLRAAFRVCHDFLSVFGFGFNLLRDSRLFAAVVGAMSPRFSSTCWTRAGPLKIQPVEVAGRTSTSCEYNGQDRCRGASFSGSDMTSPRRRS